MPKLHSFLFVIHKATDDTKAQAHVWAQKQKLLWYVIALEPYIEPGKEGHHLHMMFRCKHPRHPSALIKGFMSLFDKPREDVWEERLQGRFKDQVEYVTNEYSGEHADNPKILDPDPIIFPSQGDPDEVQPKVSIKDQVIQDILNGAKFNWLLKSYPKFIFDNEKKVRKFMEDAKAAELIKYYARPDGGPNVPGGISYDRVQAPWE